MRLLLTRECGGIEKSEAVGIGRFAPMPVSEKTRVPMDRLPVNVPDCEGAKITTKEIEAPGAKKRAWAAAPLR